MTTATTRFVTRLVVLLALGGPALALAQAHPDFTGTWTVEHVDMTDARKADARGGREGGGFGGGGFGRRGGGGGGGRRGNGGGGSGDRGERGRGRPDRQGAAVL